MRKPLALLTVFIAAGLLSACGPATPVSTAPPTTPTEATPSTPPETPEPAAASSIVIGAETTEILDQDGDVMVSLRYSEDGDEAVAEAATVLGPPTGTSHFAGDFHYSPSDTSSWGEFHITVIRYGEEPVGAARNYAPAFRVAADAAVTSDGLPVAAVDGTTVGSDYAAVAALRPADQVYVDDTFGYRSVALELPASFPGIVEDSPGFVRAYGAIGWTDPGSSIINSITSPDFLFSPV